jgi:phosphatidylinositol 4-kinase
VGVLNKHASHLHTNTNKPTTENNQHNHKPKPKTTKTKLTREVLEVLGSDAAGAPSEAFDYFKVLAVQGFLAARRARARILTRVRVMARSGFPCFAGGGDRAVALLERRFAPGAPEAGVVAHVLGLIADSLDAWSTRQYDAYQRVLNGIL